MNTHRRISLLACTLGLLAAAMPASAQSTYPDHPVKLLVALPAGGGVDIIARLVGQKLAAATGQPFVVDNRAGASGRIGLPVVAKAAPDGYTLMASPASFLTTNKSIFKELPYDPQADFAPITKLANQSMVLVVRDKQKFASAGALLAAAKAKPGALNYASSGDGSPQHLAALMFETRAGVKMTHVPYKGVAPLTNDLVGNNLEFGVFVLSSGLPHIKSGKVVALGTTEAKRSATTPDIPALAESPQYKNVDIGTWFALMAPANLPKPVFDKIKKALNDSLQSPDLRKKLEASGSTVAATSVNIDQFLATEVAKYKQIVEFAKIEE